MQTQLETPNQPEIISLIEELDAYQDTLYPAEARYALDLTTLEQQNIVFAVVRDINGIAIKQIWLSYLRPIRRLSRASIKCFYAKEIG